MGAADSDEEEGTGGDGGDTAAAPEDATGPRDHSPSAWLDRVRGVGVVQAVLAITLVALAIRLVLLGQRTMHWDEARVAYWILHTIETGDFAYRRIIHGPVIQHVNHVLVPLLGTSDVVMRLPVAVVGGLLPVTALLFREHLEDDEVAILALFLAFNAVLVYYSRFMRSDVLVAAFMFAAFGMLVRLYDTRKPRYLYAAATLIALGFGAKENAILYVLTWLGAAGLLADQALYRPRNYESGTALLRAKLGGLRRWRPTGTTRGGAAGTWGLHVLGGLVVLLVLTVFIYAPRGVGLSGMYYPPPGAGGASLGLWEAVAQPLSMPGFAVETLLDIVDQFAAWVEHGSEPSCHKDNVIDGYICYLGQYVEVMVFNAGVLTVFAVAGFLYERYGRAVSRNLVMFAAYGGFVSVIGYPFATDVFGAWLVVHAVVPLAIPATVGVAAIYRWGRAARTDDDQLAAAVSTLVLVAVAVSVVVGTAGVAYGQGSWTDDTMVQYAQPGDDLGEVIDAIGAAADRGSDGPDVVLYYGVTGEDRNDGAALVRERPEWTEGDLLTRPPCAEWFNGLPLSYYYAAQNASVECATDRAQIASLAGTEGVPVIIALEEDPTVPTGDLQAAGYDVETYELRQDDRDAQVFVHERLAVP